MSSTENKELHPIFQKEDNFTGYSFFVEHDYKGGIMRLRYENGSVVEKADLLHSGEWRSYGLGGIYRPDFWYDCALPLDAHADDFHERVLENISLAEGAVIDYYGAVTVKS